MRLNVYTCTYIHTMYIYTYIFTFACKRAGGTDRWLRKWFCVQVLHPLPRNWELGESVDSSKFCLYFAQAANGLFVRMALLLLTLCPYPFPKCAI